MDWCKHCRALIFSGNTHQCPPKWSVWIAEDPREDTEGIFHAVDAAEAAEKFIEEWDQDGYDMLTYASSTEVKVCLADGIGETKTFSVSGESVPTYTAYEVD